MQISELRIAQGNVDVEGIITDIGDTRTFDKFGRELKVANAILKDDSGSIKLTLWNDDISRFKNGDKIKINNGYVNEFQGEKQLTSGKFGNMELVESSNQSTNNDSKIDSNTENTEESYSENTETFEENNLDKTDEEEF